MHKHRQHQKPALAQPQPLGGFNTEKTTTTSKRQTQYPGIGFSRKHFRQDHPDHGRSQSIILSYDSWGNSNLIDDKFFDAFLPDKELSKQRDLDLNPAAGRHLLRVPEHCGIFASITRGKQLIHYLDYWINKLPNNTGNDGFGYDYKVARAIKPAYTYNAQLDITSPLMTEIDPLSAAIFHFDSEGANKRGKFQFQGVGINHNEEQARNEFNLEFKFAFIPEGVADTLKVKFHNDTHHVFEIKLNLHFTRTRSKTQEPLRIQNSQELVQLLLRKLQQFRVEISKEIVRPGVLNLADDKFEEAVIHHGAIPGCWPASWENSSNHYKHRKFTPGPTPVAVDIYVPDKQKSLDPRVKRVPLPAAAAAAARPTAKNRYAALPEDDES